MRVRTGGGKQARRISAEEAAALVRTGDWLDFGAGVCQPDVFDTSLAARAAELRDVKIRACLSARPRAVLEADPEGTRFQWFNWHFSGYDRRKHDAGISHYIPCNLGEISDYYRRFIDPIDLVVLKTRPMDADGMFNFSAANLWHSAVIERARVLVIEECAGLPHVHGLSNGVHVSAVDYVIAGDGRKAPELPNPPATEIDRIIARLIAAEIEDGACLQIGIGAMPNAVCAQLLDGSVRNLGVFSEMMMDGLLPLYRAGRISGEGKALYPGKISFSFALGSAELYDTLHDNPDFHCVPVECSNLPQNIMQNDRMVAINNTTQMDLQGQAASESDGFRHISGTGGQLQFVRGAYASKGGKSFICLASTYERRGVRKSRIVLQLPPGTIATVPRTDMMYVVTEYGMVNLKGKSIAERARAMISIAHPEYREGLEREARESGLIPRCYI